MGFWPGYSGIVYLDRLNAYCMENDITFTWLDGNHEDHDQLKVLVGLNPQNKNGQTYIRSNIIYSPRGCAWEMDGKRFMTVGGAYSIDKAWRKPHISWWPDETLSDKQLTGIINRANTRRLAGKSEVDYLFTHDCHPNTPFKYRIKMDIESQMHREKMREIANAVRPAMWFHGHMHEKYVWTLGYRPPFTEPEVDEETTDVYGLACDGMDDNCGVLDTATSEFTYGQVLRRQFRIHEMLKESDDDF